LLDLPEEYVRWLLLGMALANDDYREKIAAIDSLVFGLGGKSMAAELHKNLPSKEKILAWFEGHGIELSGRKLREAIIEDAKKSGQKRRLVRELMEQIGKIQG